MWILSIAAITDAGWSAVSNKGFLDGMGGYFSQENLLAAKKFCATCAGGVLITLSILSIFATFISLLWLTPIGALLCRSDCSALDVKCPRTPQVG